MDIEEPHGPPHESSSFWYDTEQKALLFEVIFRDKGFTPEADHSHGQAERARRGNHWHDHLNPHGVKLADSSMTDPQGNDATRNIELIIRRPEVDQAEAVITWHGDLIRSYAVQAASEKITRLANETITMLREKREKVVKEDGSIAARPDGEGRAQDGRNEAGTGHRPAGHTPAFDTGRPEGPLHDDGPSRLMVSANFANFANRKPARKLSREARK